MLENRIFPYWGERRGERREREREREREIVTLYTHTHTHTHTHIHTHARAHVATCLLHFYRDILSLLSFFR